jgi:hypothetical protein
LIGYLLFAFTPANHAHSLLLIDFFAGINIASSHLSQSFQNKHKEL